MTDLYAIVRIRGSVNARRTIDSTMEMLNLKKVNNCMIYPKVPAITGMLKKASTYLTWGEVSEAVLLKLLLKRGRLQGDKKIDDKQAKEISSKLSAGKRKDLEIKLPLRLSPPSKGFNSVKALFPRGDAGYRGEKINELLERMM